ncbi:hypothetical protein WCP94_003814 [Bilophila wadsworthia]
MAFLFLLCAARNGLDEGRRNLSEERRPPSPTKPTSGARVPPPPPKTFIKWGGGAKGVRSGMSWKKSALRMALSLPSLLPRTRLAGIPFERRTIPRSSALEKLRTGIR